VSLTASDDGALETGASGWEDMPDEAALEEDPLLAALL
jgi:hypothetical protein